MSAEHRPSREESTSRALSKWRAAEKFYQWKNEVNVLAPIVADKYKYDPVAYAKEVFGWEPWKGNEYGPGQVEIAEAYVKAIRQQEEQSAFEKGEISEGALQYWKPGEVIKNRIRIPAGHTVGKSKVAALLISHFFDCYPSIIYTFAPTAIHLRTVLWKNIKADRRNRPNLTGRVLETEIKDDNDPEHFVIARATSDSHGAGIERAQGQHHSHLAFIVDEAEGVADFVFEAIESMTGGGQVIVVVMLANPRSRISQFHKQGSLSNVLTLRISALYHPNVLAGREIVPGAVRRRYVESMIEQFCSIVAEHSADDHTFELPYPVMVKGTERPAGTIFKPKSEFMWKVMGIAPTNAEDKNLIPSGRFEAACNRAPVEQEPHKIRVGVDVARYGQDVGTIYIRWNGRVWRSGQPSKEDTTFYYHAIKEPLLTLKRAHPEIKDCQIRLDAGGNFAKGCGDRLKIDSDLIAAFPAQFKVIEVNNGAEPRDPKAYSNCITELTADVAETLKGIAILDPPEKLEADLCERKYHWRNKKGHEVKELEDKEDVHKRLGRSPDDGDGFVLAVASDFLVRQTEGAFSTVGHAKSTNLIDQILGIKS